MAPRWLPGLLLVCLLAAPAGAEETKLPFDADPGTPGFGPKWVVAFDVDGTLGRTDWGTGLSGLARRWKARLDAHRLDSWLHRNRELIEPVVITGGTRREAVRKLEAWGYRKTRFPRVTHDGTMMWRGDKPLSSTVAERGAEAVVRWQALLDDRWDRLRVENALLEIAEEPNPALKEQISRVEPFFGQRVGSHRLGLDATVTSDPDSKLDLDEITQRLLVEPLEAKGIQVMGVVGQKREVSAPTKKTAVSLIPYRDGRSISISVVPFRAGKWAAFHALGGNTMVCDNRNDADVVEALENEGAEHRVIATANASDSLLRVIDAHEKGPRARRDNRSRVYLAHKEAAAGALEGLLRIYGGTPGIRGAYRVRDTVTFVFRPATRATLGLGRLAVDVAGAVRQRVTRWLGRKDGQRLPSRRRDR